VPCFVDGDVTAEGRSQAGVANERRLQAVVEPGPHGIIAVKEVDDLTPGTLQTRLEVAGVPDVRCLTVERDPVPGELTDDGFRNIAGGVIDDFDLHLLRAGILLEHRYQGVAEEGGAVVRGDHHRPARSVRTRLDRFDARPVPRAAYHRRRIGPSIGEIVAM